VASRQSTYHSFLAIPLALLIGCAPAYLYNKRQQELVLVRVAVGHRLPVATIAAVDSMKARDAAHSTDIPPGSSWTVDCRQGAVRALTERGTVIQAVGSGLRLYSTRYRLNGQALAWPLELRAEGDSGLLAIVELPLEEYLAGVLARELGNAGESELEAAKAQAVAARSYAYIKIGSKPEAGYDLESDVSNQVFDLGATGSRTARKAVELTRGQVLVCGGRAVAANYHSTCGGRTAMPSEVWNTADSLFPWAKSVTDDYCRISPRFSWQERVPACNVIARLFGIADTTIRLSGVEVGERGGSGRVQSLKIASELGDTVLRRDRIRTQLGETALPSTRFELTCEFDGAGCVAAINFTGTGYGHGVGMCQWGAIGMAREGKGYKEILGTYYRRVKIKRLF